MAGDPAYVGGAPVDVAFLVIEHVFMRHCRIQQVTAGGVQHTLRLAGRTGGVQNKQGIFRVHHHRLAVG